MKEPRAVQAEIVSVPTYRATIDWPRLFAEGARLTVKGLELRTFAEPYDDRHTILVALVRVPREEAEAVQAQVGKLLTFLQAAQAVGDTGDFPGIIPLLFGRGR